MSRKGPFATYAMQALDMGYSIVPLKSDRNPLLKGWQNLRQEPLTRDRVRDLADKYPFLGIGVIGGFGGLCIIDFDTEDPALMVAVATVLPRPNVAKAGSKGFTAFYRMTGWIKGQKFMPPKGEAEQKPLVEILTTGNSAIPPTWHPKIGKPYRWLTPKTLFNTPVMDLVEITPEHIERLRLALQPWSPKREYVATPTVDRELVNDKRMSAFAQARIRNVCANLASIHSGRNIALFNAAATLGKFHHKDIVTEADVRNALMAACRLNAYEAKAGEDQCHRTISSGFDMAKNDQLPDLEALSAKSGRSVRRR